MTELDDVSGGATPAGAPALPEPLASPSPLDPPPSPAPAPAPRRPRPRGGAWLVLVAVAAIGGAIFSGFSTHDFVLHLDGQVHAIHCSVNLGDDAVVGQSGCKDAMLSPWSSFFRTSLWGGLPVALVALGIYAFLAALALSVLLRRDRTRRDTLLLLLGSLVPAGGSGYWGWIAATRLTTFCQVCVGMYIASGLLLVFAIVAHWRAPSAAGTPRPWGRWALTVFEGLAVVGALVLLYVQLVPSDRKSLEGCGRLVTTEDPKGVLLDLPGSGKTPAITVLDPLCPACRAFDQRLAASGLGTELDTRVLLFPLDARCNWMVKQSLHPGACAVSEAMLCAPDQAGPILDWAFAEQERLLALGASDPKAVEREVISRFPAVDGCVGTAKAKDRITSSLRFAVANALPVLTPQLYVRDVRLCDEDTDLGLEYTLHQMLTRRAEAGGTP